MTTSEHINELAAAAAKAQAELRPAAKDARNAHFGSKYADHAAIVEASKVYPRHGIAIFQDVTVGDPGVAVTTRLTHTSGQWLEFGPLVVPVGKRDAHGVGSAATYAKRYALASALGIAADDDDDGNAAVGSSPEPVYRLPDVAPEGYAAWASALTAAAAAGVDALQSAWKDAPAVNRKHFAAVSPDGLDRLKKIAAKVAA
jgi:hypothetical protein